MTPAWQRDLADTGNSASMATLQNRLILWFGTLGLAIAAAMASVSFYLLEHEMGAEAATINNILRNDLDERLAALHADFDSYLERELARIEHDAVHFVSGSDVRIFMEKGQTDPLAEKLSSFTDEAGLDFALLVDNAGIVIASARAETDQIGLRDYLRREGLLSMTLDRRAENSQLEGSLVSQLVGYRPEFFERLAPATGSFARVDTYGPLNIQRVRNDFGEQLGYLLAGKRYFQQQAGHKQRFEEFPEPVIGYYLGRPHFTLAIDGTPDVLSEAEMREISSLPDGKIVQLSVENINYLFQCKELSILRSPNAPIHCVGKPLELAERVLQRVTAASTQAQRTVLKAFIVIVLLSALVFLLLNRFIATRISAPIQSLSNAFRRFSDGELSAPIPRPEGTMEIDQLIASATSFRQVVVKRAQAEYHLAMTNRELEVAVAASKQANEAKSAFISSMSHEMRTPLNAVIGFSELLSADLEALGDAKGAAHARYVHGAGESLLNIVEKVISYSDLPGRVPIDTQPVDLAETLADVSEMVCTKAEEKNLTLACCSNNYRIQGEPAMLRQAVLNILENAILFAEPGGTVAIDCAPAGKNFLRVTITDNGPGFPRGREDDAFLAFERLKQTTGTISGAGLGLTIARYLIEAMGGKVDIDSDYREGARVWVELSLSPSDESLAEETL